MANFLTVNLGTEESPELISVDNVCKIIFEADTAHTLSLEQCDKFDKLKSYGPILKAGVVKYVTDFCCQAIAVSEVIKNRGYFK